MFSAAVSYSLELVPEAVLVWPYRQERVHAGNWSISASPNIQCQPYGTEKIPPFQATTSFLNLTTLMALHNGQSMEFRKGKVELSLPPLGSSAGNISPPQIDHAATAVTIPAKPTINISSFHMQAMELVVPKKAFLSTTLSARFYCP